MPHSGRAWPIPGGFKDDAGTLTGRARDAAAQARPAEAEGLLRRAVAIEPGFVPAYLELAWLLCERGESDAALALLDEVLAARPKAAWALSLKAAVLEAEHRTGEALVVHEALLAQASDAAVPWLNYGHALKASGRVKEAVAAYRKAIAIDPGNGFAWWGLANLHTVRLSAEDIAAMERALLRATGVLVRVQLHFALGRALGDAGQLESSFGHYREANRVRGTLVAYDGETDRGPARRAKATFPPEVLAQRAGQGCAAPDPIFVVGMPRSGSTLVEQILASHPLIEGAGELDELHKLATSLGGEVGRDWPEAVVGLGATELQALGERYLARTRRFRRTGRPFFTDKMPANWRYLSLIRLILPNAKIIDVRRDPLACCFSAFTTYFARDTRFPTSLEDLGRYYRSYVDLTDSFAAGSPGRVHRVQYERLVEDLEGEVRRLLTYLGLPFDEACLRFHENPRVVYTPSAQQVREPVNRSGLQRWSRYEPWLAPLKHGLGGVEPGPSNIIDSNYLRRPVRAPSVMRAGEAVLCPGDVS